MERINEDILSVELKQYINTLYIKSNISMHERDYKQSLDYYLEIISFNICSYEILINIVEIYKMFQNYTYALKFINISIEQYHNINDYITKYIILVNINNYDLLLNFSNDINKLDSDSDEIFSLKNLIKLKLESFSIDQKLNPSLVELKKNYTSKINDFCKLIKMNSYDVFKDSKIEFRYFCYYYNNLIKTLTLPEISMNQSKEAVLIEFRILPHLEFVIRNTIHKLGKDWSHTIICGNLNYNYLLELCNSISSNIKIIKLNCDNLENIHIYTQILTSLDFWKFFVGDKILIYQEDTCIFKHNINDFLEWDYIGAPFKKKDNTNSIHIGNGGFSLRTKQIMIDVINKINQITPPIQLDNIPEDLYFSNNMIKYNIGKIADYQTALQFSTEYIVHEDTVGGHSFFLHNTEWQLLMYKQLLNHI